MSKYSNQNSRYTIELTTTQKCNFKCQYCFEEGFVPKRSQLSAKLPKLIKQLENIFDDPWFDMTFNNKNISFWGGEPSLGIDMIYRIVEHFIEDQDVTFFIYTNGSRIKQLLPLFHKCKSMRAVGGNKFTIQISYDGMVLQDLRRSGSSRIVLEGMDILHRAGIPFGLKSTVTYQDFKYLPDTWHEYSQLHEKYGVKLSTTVDYHNIDFYNHRDSIEENLLKIAQYEMEFHKNHGYFLSNILTGTKFYCGCGKGMMSVDVDGKAYYCHGCFYSDKVHETANIFDNDIVDKIKNNFGYFYNHAPVNDECAKCVALTCLKCNVKKYEASEKSKFLEKWHDYTSQPEICDYYKLTGRIGRAMLNILREEN